MSKAGFDIPHVAVTYKGGDGKWYFIKASQMSKYLKKWCVATVNNAYRVKNGLVYQHKDGNWVNKDITGHVDVVYRDK